MALSAHSTSCFKWPSLRSSPSAIRCAPGIGPRSGPFPRRITSGLLFADDCVLYRNIHSLQDCLTLQEDLTSLGQWEADWQMKFNVAKCHSMRATRHQHHKQILFDYTIKLWKMFSRQNTLVSPLQITWIGVSMSQKSLPKQLRHLVSFAGIWLLHLGVQRKLHTKLWFGLN